MPRGRTNRRCGGTAVGTKLPPLRPLFPLLVLLVLPVTLALPAPGFADEPSSPNPAPTAPPSASPSSAAAPRPRARVPLDVVIDKSKVDLTDHHLEIRASRDLVRITIKVIGDSGNVLDADERDLGPQPAGKPLVVGWSPTSDEPVARIEVFAYDADGYYKGIAITPWTVFVPHEEVNFPFDSSRIEDSERPKLEASYTKITEALASHAQLRVGLFVAGHTDTVGDPGYNLRLSRLRAQAIARWFRQRGLKIPIAFEGFGESALLVKTADEVDEPRNRRADYILSVEEPVLKTSGFRPSWNRIP
jgi:outer membrane protein OmpA-like peptidoglycan-associated protein